jgi:hypothetical protein
VDNTFEAAVSDHEFEDFLENPKTPEIFRSDDEDVVEEIITPKIKEEVVIPFNSDVLLPVPGGAIKPKPDIPKYGPGRYRKQKPKSDLREVINNNKTKESGNLKIKTDFKSIRKVDYESLQREHDYLLKKVATLEAEFRAKRNSEILPVHFNLEKVRENLKVQFALVKEIERKVSKYLKEA